MVGFDFNCGIYYSVSMIVEKRCADEMRRLGMVQEKEPTYDAETERSVAYIMSIREQNRRLDKTQGNC